MFQFKNESHAIKVFLIIGVCFLLQGCDFGVEKSFKSIMNSFPGGGVLLWIHAIPDWDISWTTSPGWFWKSVLGSHRSAITHSCIPIIIISAMLRPLSIFGFIVSILSGCLIALHFVFDLFPNGWFYDKSWIHFPIVGSLSWIPLDGNIIPVLISILWLIINICLCVAIPVKIYELDGE